MSATPPVGTSDLLKDDEPAPMDLKPFSIAEVICLNSLGSMLFFPKNMRT
jgi:hypothetical protein